MAAGFASLANRDASLAISNRSATQKRKPSSSNKRERRANKAPADLGRGFLILLAKLYERRLRFVVYCTTLVTATPALPVPVVNGEPVTTISAGFNDSRRNSHVLLRVI